MDSDDSDFEAFESNLYPIIQARELGTTVALTHQSSIGQLSIVFAYQAKTMVYLGNKKRVCLCTDWLSATQNGQSAAERISAPCGN